MGLAGRCWVAQATSARLRPHFQGSRLAQRGWLEWDLVSASSKRAMTTWSLRRRPGRTLGLLLLVILSFLVIRSWLLQDSGMKLRTTYKGFTEAVDLYFDHLMSRVVPLQYKHGGPIIAVQVENEYGSYDRDPAYMPYIKKALEDRGIIELLLTSDNKDGLKKGMVHGVLATINLQTRQELQLMNTFLVSVQGIQPKMVMEYWTGWFDSWGGPHNILDSSEVLETVTAIIDAGSSINLYMFHGGTNFGFINGAMHFHEYKSDVTSYDYDAVLTEAGDYTAKYSKLREFFGSFSDAPLPPPPKPLPKMTYEPLIPVFYLSLWDVLSFIGEPIKSEKPINMENLPVNDGNGQAFGYILYETIITSSGTLSGVVRDRGQVFLDTVSIGFMDYKTTKIIIPLIQGYTFLRILVENRGRVNYGNNIDDQRKGIIGNLYLNDSPLKKFRIYSLDMKQSFFQRFSIDKWTRIPDVPTFPAFFFCGFVIGSSPSDTFLKLEGWEKGVIFVNGQNLGRYWNIGPQETLYLPGPWLFRGNNQVGTLPASFCFTHNFLPILAPGIRLPPWEPFGRGQKFQLAYSFQSCCSCSSQSGSQTHPFHPSWLPYLAPGQTS
ncbi:beta-galactosidase-1-like protein 2 isoform X6 [Marmota monax]|uniref:beta-galactosidase-1-like protein 2 isoform X6 n=1 Tax=Marmota monax TaxID=9995 RepID=UPI0026F377D3|nr:beta-galactosidase-1-like protein 2 isoform X6 [Marmota monax]